MFGLVYAETFCETFCGRMQEKITDIKLGLKQDETSGLLDAG